MIQQIPHNKIYTSPLNPRKAMDADKLGELAESILQEGLLQNLVVRPHPDGENFEIAAGERRWRAIQSLIDGGSLPADHTVPAVVRDLTELQLLQLATTENMNRADMTPLEEAGAFLQMLQLGSDVESISAETGLSVPTVRKRLALTERLAPAAQEALADGRINLGQAQALTVGTLEQQEQVLDYDWNWTHEGALKIRPNDIQLTFKRSAIPVSRAKFDRSLYTGEYNSPGIFDPEGEDTFVDTDQFMHLQREHVQELLETAQKSWAWAEINDGNHWQMTQMDEDEHDPETQGVIIIFRESTGEIDVRERMLKNESRHTGRSMQEVDPAALTQKHVEEIGRQRKYALQTALLGSAMTVVKQTLILLLLPRTDVESHLSVNWQLDDSDGSKALQIVLDDLARDVPTIHARMQDTEPSWMNPGKYDPAVMWTELTNLDSASLDLLLTALTARVLLVHGSQVNPGTQMLFNELKATEQLPSFAQLGTDWLDLHRPARLRQVSQTVLGFGGEGKTKKELIGLIDAAQSDDVPAELLLPYQKEEELL